MAGADSGMQRAPRFSARRVAQASGVQGILAVVPPVAWITRTSFSPAGMTLLARARVVRPHVTANVSPERVTLASTCAAAAPSRSISERSPPSDGMT